MNPIEQQAFAWRAVHDELAKINPGFVAKGETGQDGAIRFIRELGANYRDPTAMGAGNRGELSLRDCIASIANDYVPDHPRDAAQALEEMRAALKLALEETSPAPPPSNGCDGVARQDAIADAIDLAREAQKAYAHSSASGIFRLLAEKLEAIAAAPQPSASSAPEAGKIDVVERVAEAINTARFFGRDSGGRYALALECARAALEAAGLAGGQDVIREALEAVKIRLHFNGMPQEPMFNFGTDDAPRWRPDWRYEIALIEHALHGAPLTPRPESTRRDQIPPAHPESAARQEAGDPVCGACEGTGEVMDTEGMVHPCYYGCQPGNAPRHQPKARVPPLRRGKAMSEPVALLPCPFCGSPAKFEYEHFRFFVSCHHCGFDQGERDNKKAAIDAWNRRAHPPSERVRELVKVAGEALDWILDATSRRATDYEMDDPPIEALRAAIAAEGLKEAEHD